MKTSIYREITTEQRICNWAKWSRAGGPSRVLGYKSPSLALIRQKMGGGVRLPAISDDEAMLVDAVVTRLKEKRADLWLALVLYYGVQQDVSCAGSYTACGRCIGTHKHQAKAMVESALAWIDGQFDGSGQFDVDEAA